MEEQGDWREGFIEHVVKWALALPVGVRRDLVAAAQAQAQASLAAPPTPPHIPFADAAVWREIARRIEEEGHTPRAGP